MSGMDKLSQGLIEKAMNDALDALMKQRPGGGRLCYLVAVVADGPHAAKCHVYTPMNNAVALQIADALEHEADSVRTSAQAGLMASAQRAQLKQRQGDGRG